MVSAALHDAFVLSVLLLINKNSLQHVSVSQKVPGFGYSPPTIPGGEPQPTQNLIKAFDFIDNEVR